jgi:serine/threonine-protein kinase
MRLGKYDNLVRIASGGMGTVYRGIDTETGRQIALKVLSTELAENPATLERFNREADAAARLRHPNIVSVFKRGKKDGMHYLVMEYVDGIDLHQYVTATGPLKPAEVAEILHQAARALEHAHARDIVHRDIKPSNLLLTYHAGKRLVKLTDFGLAVDRNAPNESHLTRPGTTVGTVDFMAPEQARGRNLTDCRSDIYALGCTAYFMLTGQPPFPEGSVPEKLYKHVHVYPPDPREFDPDIPDDLIRILGRMMAKKPEDRYQSVAELLADLEQFRARLHRGRISTLDLLPGANGESEPQASLPFQHRLVVYEADEPAFLPQQSAWLMLAGIAVVLTCLAVLFVLWLA